MGYKIVLQAFMKQKYFSTLFVPKVSFLCYFKYFAVLIRKNFSFITSVIKIFSLSTSSSCFGFAAVEFKILTDLSNNQCHPQHCGSLVHFLQLHSFGFIWQFLNQLLLNQTYQLLTIIIRCVLIISNDRFIVIRLFMPYANPTFYSVENIA